MIDYQNNGRWRKGRKARTCWECGRALPVGAIYWEDTGETPAYQSGDPFCETCATTPQEVNGRLFALATPRDAA